MKFRPIVRDSSQLFGSDRENISIWPDFDESGDRGWIRQDQHPGAPGRPLNCQWRRSPQNPAYDLLAPGRRRDDAARRADRAQGDRRQRRYHDQCALGRDFSRDRRAAMRRIGLCNLYLVTKGSRRSANWRALCSTARAISYQRLPTPVSHSDRPYSEY
jgi:hypothetical protein